jgi:hypothetical protein
MSATANAGAAISDKRYWPSEVGPSAYRAVNTQHAPRDAFAAIGRTASPAVASASAEEDTSQPGCWSARRAVSASINWPCAAGIDVVSLDRRTPANEKKGLG